MRKVTVRFENGIKSISFVSLDGMVKTWVSAHDFIHFYEIDQDDIKVQKTGLVE